MAFESPELKQPGTVPRYARTDVIGGAAMVFIAALIWYGAIGLDVGTIANFGSGATPKALAIVLFVAGGAVFLQGLKQRNEEAERFELALRPAAVVTLAILLFGLFVRGENFGLVSTPQLGLMVVGPLTVFIAGCATREARAGELLVLAFGLTAATLVVFPDLLGVSIPAFPKFVEKAIPAAFGYDTAIRVLYCAYGALAAVLYAAFFGLSEKRA